MENNKISVPLEVSLREAIAEKEFWRNRSLLYAIDLNNTQIEVEEKQREIEHLQSEKQLQQAEIDRLTARVNAPQMQAIIDDDEVDDGE